MKIKKSQLEALYQALKGTEGVLSLKEARVRDAFLKPLTEVFGAFEQDRLKIYHQFCNKNDDGTPAIQDNKFHFKREVVAEMNAELNILNEEEVELDAPENLKDLIEATTYKPKEGESAVLDDIISNL